MKADELLNVDEDVATKLKEYKEDIEYIFAMAEYHYNDLDSNIA